MPAGHSAGHSTTPTNRGRPTDPVAATLPYNRPNLADPPGNPYNSLPPRVLPPDDGTPRYANGLADEFGASRPAPNTGNVADVVVPPVTIPSAPLTTSSNPGGLRRPDSSGGVGGGGNRFTVTNLQPNDIPHSTPTPARQLSSNATGSGPSSGNVQQKWLRAEDEKNLYKQARANVEKLQGVGSTPVCFLWFCDPSR